MSSGRQQEAMRPHSISNRRNVLFPLVRRIRVGGVEEQLAVPIVANLFGTYIAVSSFQNYLLGFHESASAGRNGFPSHRAPKREHLPMVSIRAELASMDKEKAGRGSAQFEHEGSGNRL
jgi:hypothetical protein